MKKIIRKTAVSQKPTFGKLAVSYNGKIFHIAPLIFNQIKQEFFYEFALEQGKDSHKVEHVSFHADGNIHLKLRKPNNKEKYLNRIKGNPNLFAFKNNDCVPLLVNSFFFSDPNADTIFPKLATDQE